ncbi:MAG: CDGSH iron-sulfur domain-containing protein [Nitrososphaeraceae archaeon]|jgi:CDGSH-type Zn-finger protein
MNSILARLVKKEYKGPLEIKVGTNSMWICMCGLSSNQPFCDESHKKTADEEDNKTYAYEREGDRIEVRNWEVVY